MTTLNRGPAEIIAFPLRGRFAAAVQHDEPNTAYAAAGLPRAASGSAWYHEEAIREERDRTN